MGGGVCFLGLAKVVFTKKKKRDGPFEIFGYINMDIDFIHELKKFWLNPGLVFYLVNGLDNLKKKTWRSCKKTEEKKFNSSPPRAT